MKESVQNTKALLHITKNQATATPTNNTPTATVPVTRLGPVGTNNRTGFYIHVAEPTSREGYVIGRDC